MKLLFFVHTLSREFCCTSNNSWRKAALQGLHIADSLKRAFSGTKAGATSGAKTVETAAADSSSDSVVRLGLTAFAVSAYIKSILCPALASYTPRMTSAAVVDPISPHSLPM